MTDAAPNNVTAFPGPDAPMGEREPPHNLELEAALLGALMAHNAKFPEVVGEISPEHFANGVHARIFAAISGTIGQGLEATPTTLKAIYDQHGGLAEIGGSAFLFDIAEAAAGMQNVRQYARQLRDLWLRRRLIECGEDLINTAHDVRYDCTVIDTAPRYIEAAMDLLAQDGGRRSSLCDPETLADAALAPKADRRAVSFGYADLDHKIGGMEPGDLIVLAGRPSMGKTALALNVATRAARSGWNVGFQSLEMGRAKIGARLLSMASRVPLSVVREQSFDQTQALALTEARKRLKALPLRVDCPDAMRADQLAAAVNEARRSMGGLNLLVIDYLGLLDGDGLNANERVSGVMKTIKRLALREEAPVLLLAQLSREVEKREDKRPQLSDLRDSGSIEQDADAVILCFREAYYLERAEPVRRDNEGEAKFWERYEHWQRRLNETRSQIDLNVAKSRQGEVGVCSLWWDGPTNRVAPLRSEPDDRQNEMEV